MIKSSSLIPIVIVLALATWHVHQGVVFKFNVGVAGMGASRNPAEIKVLEHTQS